MGNLVSGRVLARHLWSPCKSVSQIREAQFVCSPVLLFERPLERSEVVVCPLMSIDEGRAEIRRRVRTLQEHTAHHSCVQDRAKHIVGRRIWMEEDRDLRASWRAMREQKVAFVLYR